MKVLILGGYGFFGGRLVSLLSDESALTLIIAGRCADKTKNFIEAYSGASTLIPAAFDRADVVGYLITHQPDLVVDASGPFQIYGDDPYFVINACIAAGVPYIDLADGSEFVTGITRFDNAATDAGVFVLSGVSTCPALTSAVVTEVARDFEPETIRAGISPAPHAVPGLSVMRSILSYAGDEVLRWQDGRLAKTRAFVDSYYYRIAPPGYRPLKRLRYSLVDVPDLRLLQHRFTGLADVWFGAGPTPAIYHRILSTLAWCRGRLRLPALHPLAPAVHWLLTRFSWGPNRGGMFVEVRGRLDGVAVTRSWHLIAEGDDGPFIPAIPASVVIKKLLNGTTPDSGARAAVDLISLSDYQRAFQKLQVHSGFRQTGSGGQARADTVYDTVLAAAMTRLPAPVRDLHNVTAMHRWQGTAQVRGSSNLLARLVAAVIGFPGSGRDVPLTVTLTRQGDREVWERDFNGQKFHSVQWAGTGVHHHLLMERFGFVTVQLTLDLRDDELHLVPVGWTFAGLPLPVMLLPTGAAFETARDGRFVFDVTVNAPIIGRIVAYRGVLKRVSD